MNQIQSNCISGEFKEDIISRTLQEVYDSIKCVYGPYGSDIFIKKNGQLYFTRDGKEVLNSMRFDNMLSADVLMALYQAVEKQTRTAGDGSTTLVMLYINLYKLFMENKNKLAKYPSSDVRREYNSLMKLFAENIKEHVTNLSDEDFKSMLFTCTQDPDLVMKIYDNLKEDLKDESTYIIVNPSDFDEDLTIERNESPIISCDKLYSYYGVEDTFKSDNARILYVDGMLDLAHEDVMALLLDAEFSNYGKPLMTNPNATDHNADIIILCGGVSEATRQTFQRIKTTPGIKGRKDLNNILIFRLTNYATYPKIYKEDLVSYIYNIEELDGTCNQHSFEACILKSLVSDLDAYEAQYTSLGKEAPSIIRYDVPTSNMDRIITALQTSRSVHYSIGDGLKVDGALTEISKARYMKLKEDIANEKSVVLRNEMIRRIRNIFGVFIEVKVGSKLLKDSQRKFELILDAIISSQEAFSKGVITNNSLVVAIHTIGKLRGIYSTEDTIQYDLLEIVQKAMLATLVDLKSNKEGSTIDYSRNDRDGLITKEMCQIENYLNHGFNLRPDEKKVVSSDGEEISTTIIEPVTIINTLMENSTLALDLARSEVFVVNGLMGNYI